LFQSPNFKIRHLVDAPKAAVTLEQWFIGEWTPYYGITGPGDARADLAACRSRDALPICLVALGEGDRILGTASLKSKSVGAELGVGPWLAAVLVGAAHRNKGIATALIAEIEAEAAGMGFEAVYTSSDADGIAGIVARRGWQRIGGTDSLRGQLSVYRRYLRAP